MKNKRILIILAIFMVVFVILSSYFWYMFFLDLGTDGKINTNNNSNTSIIMIDENKVYAMYSKGKEYNENAPGYKFKVVNNGVKTGNYTLRFVEIQPSQINDGCTKESLLKKSELNYMLYLNDKVYKSGTLDELNGILDTNYLNIDASNRYELQIWVNDTASNFNGRHFHYKIEIEVNE